jgi:hypothetical protein
MTRPGSQSLRVALAGLALLLPGLRAHAVQAPGVAPAAKTTIIKSIHLDRSGDVWIVRIEADGPLPAPKIGELDAPARVFLDFAGVRTKTAGVQGAAGAPIMRVRAAVNSVSPLLTRVVIDLSARQPIRTEAEQLPAGRFNVLVGEVADSPQPPASPSAKTTGVKPAASPQPPAANAQRAPTPTDISPVGPLPSPRPDTPPPGTPAAPPTSPAPAPVTPAPSAMTSPATSPPAVSPLPARSTTPPVPARDAQKYLEQIGPTLNRYRKLQPALVSIDRQDPKPAGDLTAIREESAAVLRALTAYRPGESVRPTHDLLVRSASFALMAATLRHDAGTQADPEKLRNAASAAAGALLLLDRVCSELGCSPSDERRN